MDPNGGRIDYTYDYADRVLSKWIVDLNTDSVLYKEDYSYVVCLDGNIKTQKVIAGYTDVSNITLVSYTDIYGRTVADGVIHNSSEQLNRYTYDSFGNKLTEISAKDMVNGKVFTHKYTYDINGNVTSVCNVQNKTAYTTYDWLGNKLIETDLLGHTSTYTYDSFGRVLTKTILVDNEQTSTTTYNYDKNGNLIRETRPTSYTEINESDDNGSEVGNDTDDGGDDNGDTESGEGSGDNGGSGGSEDGGTDGGDNNGNAEGGEGSGDNGGSGDSDGGNTVNPGVIAAVVAAKAELFLLTQEW